MVEGNQEKQLISTDKWRERDIRHIWHPYTSITEIEKKQFPIIANGNGCYLYDSKGNKYLDAISSWWCTNLGHSNRKIVDAIKTQVDTLQHSMLADMSHESAIILAEKLINICPKGLEKVLFASDGSSAVESAIRIALQYWYNLGIKEKTHFVSLEGSYHGDTFGSISLGYIDKFHSSIKQYIGNVAYKAIVHNYDKCQLSPERNVCECMESIKKIIEENHRYIAGIIIEPLCQGCAGMRIYKKEYLQNLRKICNKYNILLIADEVAVGFGRTGKMFACNVAEISPDILILGKAMSGGYLPISATVVAQYIYDSFRNGKTLYFGNTFSGNPIASSAAIAALEIYDQMDFSTEDKKDIIENLMQELQSKLPSSSHRYLGMIFASEISDIDGGSKLAQDIANICISKGLLIRPMDKTIYLYPPLTISREEFSFAGETIISAITTAIQNR